MDDTLAQAKELFDQHELVASLVIVTRIIENEGKNRDAFILRARIYYKSQLWGKAMNDFGSVLEIDPDNQEAKSGIEMARSILGYFTPDMFNP
jgi:hypothetical protein